MPEITAYARYRLIDRRLAMPIRRYENGVRQMVWLCEVTDNQCPLPMISRKYQDVISEQALQLAEKV